jgi:hypothetical protein
MLPEHRLLRHAPSVNRNPERHRKRRSSVAPARTRPRLGIVGDSIAGPRASDRYLEVR